MSLQGRLLQNATNFAERRRIINVQTRKLVNSISYTRDNMTYILVYNEEKYYTTGETRLTREGINRQKTVSVSHHRNELYKTMRGLAKEEFVIFGLDQFKNFLFKNVYTYTEKEFEKNFILCHRG